MSFLGLGEYNHQMKNEIEECYFEIYKVKPHISEAIDIAKSLPKEIHSLAKQWGWSDTEVINKVFKYIRDDFNKTNV